MSHADTYLKATLSDMQDSTARGHWRRIRDWRYQQRHNPNVCFDREIGSAMKWLSEHDYVDDQERWTNKTFQ